MTMEETAYSPAGCSASEENSLSGVADSPISIPAEIISACKPSKTEPAIKSQYMLMARKASSLPGIGYVTSSGLELLSRMAMTGIFNLLASRMAMASLNLGFKF